MTPGQTLSLPEPVAHHLQVLRLRIGERITLFNGEGGEFLARLTSIERRQAKVCIEEHLPREAELPYAITLAQALPEGNKMDWIVEKAVELGATVIQPLQAQRCVVKLAADRAARKLAHWQAIAVAACEQSGRNRIPTIAEPAGLAAWLASALPAAASLGAARLLLSPRADISLPSWAGGQAPQPVALLIGPEGGFSPDEEQAALAHGATLVSMGARILRTETAGVAAMAALNAIWHPG